MNEEIIQSIASELKISVSQVQNTLSMLEEGNTVPFIARYRKEMHGAMDDTTLRTLYERLNYLRSLNERKETVKRAIKRNSFIYKYLPGEEITE